MAKRVSRIQLCSVLQDGIEGSGFEDFDNDAEVIRVSVSSLLTDL